MIRVSTAGLPSETRARIAGLFAGSSLVVLEEEEPGKADVAFFEASSSAELAQVSDVPVPVVLLLSAGSPDARLVRAALRAGIRVIVPSDQASAAELEAAAVAAHAGLIALAPGVATAWLPDFASADAEAAAGAGSGAAELVAEPLSGRELEVLDLIAAGLPNKLIAFRLGITEHTVKSHVSSIFAKLGAGSRTEAVSQGVRRGLVML